MTDDHKPEKQAIKNAAQGQELTNAWHRRMAEIDSRAPRVPKPNDDPKRGAVSPLGGKVW